MQNGERAMNSLFVGWAAGGSVRKHSTARRNQNRRDRSYRRRFLAARIEGLEPRLMLASDLLLADSVTDSILRFEAGTGNALGPFVTAGSGGLVNPLDPTFGPDGNLYVISNDPGNAKILRYDGDNGTFIDAFVDTGQGGFSGASAIEFGPDGNLYAATNTPSGVLR
jgi:hypothetical protein